MWNEKLEIFLNLSNFPELMPTFWMKDTYFHLQLNLDRLLLTYDGVFSRQQTVAMQHLQRKTKASESNKKSFISLVFLSLTRRIFKETNFVNYTKPNTREMYFQNKNEILKIKSKNVEKRTRKTKSTRKTCL